MRISSIQCVNDYEKYRYIKKNKSIILQQQTAANIFNTYLGRDLVFFGKRPFHETLKDNYFQLPRNCFPDEFQLQAGKSLNDGKSVIVEAPTGTGKTAIAHYVMSKNLKENKTTFYTTPLKALSNQKLKEFRKIYGDENVGILTGDRRENENAPIVVMTTEVYRNMVAKDFIEQQNSIINNPDTVIFDEFHYLGDFSRGGNWEEAIMFTPKNVQILGLSATIGNSPKLQDWLNYINDNNTDLVSIPSEKRYVPLEFYTIPTKAYKKSENRMYKQLTKNGMFDYEDVNQYSPRPNLSDFKTTINSLYDKNQLPAIFFVFSKKFSKELLDYFEKENKSLTTDEEKSEIEYILSSKKREKYIGYDLNEQALINGYAIHNAGIIPAQKELIEELFQKKLLKVVIATETLAAGINMPAKTVVISSPYKPADENETNENKRLLTSNEFKQMAGRAGRRGIDTKGYVYVMPTDRVSEMDFMELEIMDCNPVESRYEPNYAFLCGFFEHNTEPRDLKDIFEKSFYVYNSQDENSEIAVQKLIQDCLLKTDILLERGFLKNDDGEYSLTNKGLMASKVLGYNPILLVDMIQSGILFDVKPETLAAIACAIANPAKNNNEELILNCEFKGLNNFQLRDCLQSYIIDAEQLKQQERNNDLPVKDETPAKVCAEIAYNWVLMNKNFSSTITNWEELNSIFNYKNVDEGTIYRSILQGADLLGQIMDMAQVGLQTSTSENEKEYYKNLKKAAKTARRLMIKQPVEV